MGQGDRHRAERDCDAVRESYRLFRRNGHRPLEDEWTSDERSRTKRVTKTAFDRRIDDRKQASTNRRKDEKTQNIVNRKRSRPSREEFYISAAEPTERESDEPNDEDSEQNANRGSETRNSVERGNDQGRRRERERHHVRDLSIPHVGHDRHRARKEHEVDRKIHRGNHAYLAVTTETILRYKTSAVTRRTTSREP